MDFKTFPLSIKRIKESLDSSIMSRYPYTEGDNNLRKILLDYVERLEFVNNLPYEYNDIDEKGLSVHNLTFTINFKFHLI